MARIHTIADYQPYHVTIPERVRSRYCPGMRSCWAFSFTSYNPFNRPTSTDTLRRICMILTLASRTLLDVLGLWNNIVGLRVLGIVISLILGLIGFFFMAFCLATIGDAEGETVVMRRNVVSIPSNLLPSSDANFADVVFLQGRWHLDAFLLFCALFHVSLLISHFFGLWAGFLGFGFGTAWVIMWILIVVMAWISTWDSIPLSLA